MRPHLSACRRVDESPGEQHLHRVLAPDVPGHGHAWGRAEQSVADAGRGKPAVVAGDGEIACGDELAPGGGGDPVWRGDDRHGHRLDRGHQPVAHGENIALLLEAPVRHLLEVMSGRERTPGPLENDRPHLRTGTLPLELGCELFHEARGERVQMVGPVERDDRRREPVLRQQVFERRCHLSPPAELPFPTTVERLREDGRAIFSA